MDERCIHLIFSDDNLIASYVSDGEVMLRYSYPYGLKFLDGCALGKSAVSSIDNVIVTLFEQISLFDRIPVLIKIESVRHKEWLRKSVQGLSYTQFYTEGKPMRVNIIDTIRSSPSYARHSQTLQSFKI